MNKLTKILSDITIFEKYAKFNDLKNRRENWEEICERNMNMHIQQYPQLENQIKEVYTNYVIPKKVLPSMRSLQFGGKPIAVNQSRMFNCAYGPVDNYKFFSEAMFLLLGGTGLGFSVQRHHINNLPIINEPKAKNSVKYVVGDSIEGWADAINMLVKSYMFPNRRSIRFDFTDIRKKGEPLITSGGKAPGPDPLVICVAQISSIFNGAIGRKLTSLEVHDIICFIADAVLAGGIRRAALISLFDKDDDEMLSCKSEDWWEKNPQRARSNNSAVLDRNTITKEEFYNVWKKCELSMAGDPGIYLTNDIDWGTNPCCEIALRPFQFCNLTEINASTIESQEDFNERAFAASFLGTLQAGYTDFHYLRPIWKETTEKDALIGVSMTGIASNKVFKYNIKEAVDTVNSTNRQIADVININHAARTTCVKPAGTTSLVLGTSSGIHAWHNDFYIRRMKLLKASSLYTYLYNNFPNLIEDDLVRPHDTAFVCIPISAPEGSTTRFESPFNLLERIKLISGEWVKNGHNDGLNTHNVSATVSLRDDEWEDAVDWMWENKEYYNGLAVFPFYGGTHKQMPFEDITASEFYEKVNESNVESFNIDNVVELIDYTDLKGELACAGGSCEIV